jgi:mercuric ion transport protein
MADYTATKNRSLIAASLAAVGASICCVGPFVLLMLGVGGAWIGNLTALEPVWCKNSNEQYDIVIKQYYG